MFNRKINNINSIFKKNKKQSSSNANNEYADFYKDYDYTDKSNTNYGTENEYNELSFNDDDQVQDEQIDYDYNENNNYAGEAYEKRKKRRKKLLLIAMIVLVLAIALLITIVILKSPRIKLNEDSITLNVGESKYISFEVINTEDPIATTFSSEDIAVAKINEDGNITAIGPGVTNVIISYTISNIKRKEKCKVTVIGDTGDVSQENGDGANNSVQETPTPTPTPNPSSNSQSCDKAPNFSLSITNAKEGEWINKDVIISISTSSNCGGTVSTKYGINCTSSSCNYTNISGNSVTITKSGINTVTFVAKDSNGKEISNSVKLMIDKTAPTVSLLPDGRTTFQPKNPITTELIVCASCTDSESGCVEKQVCNTFKTGTTGTLTVKDKAGNVGTSKTFTVNSG